MNTQGARHSTRERFQTSIFTYDNKGNHTAKTPRYCPKGIKDREAKSIALRRPKRKKVPPSRLDHYVVGDKALNKKFKKLKISSPMS